MHSLRTFLFALPLLLAACATSYAPSERAARLEELAPAAKPGAVAPDIGAILERAPAATWPATIALVRVQERAPSFRSWPLDSPGGKWSVHNLREVERAEHLGRLRSLPGVRDVAFASSLLVPQFVDGDEPLRVAAARMQADLLVIYTFDSAVRLHDRSPILTLLTLGLAPVQEQRATSTAQCILLDVRTGYFYGGAEATEARVERQCAWSELEGLEDDRVEVERAAFEKLVTEFGNMWSEIVAKHANAAPAPVPRS